MGHIDELCGGFRQFRDETDPEERANFRELVDQGQNPDTLFLACCDSRVDPALITRSQPGQLFVVRNIASLVPAYDGSEQLDEMAAALEFGVDHLKVKDIVVMGHSRCAGIKTLLSAVRDDRWPQGPLHNWLRIAEGAARETLTLDGQLSEAEQITNCCKRALATSVQRLQGYPSIRTRLAARNLSVHAWFFSMGRMRLEAFNPNTAGFDVIS